jgi:hypothetical protein|tara:strand:- start:3026 stop:3547 length:522 start_codon:yes stop_codon:yes gene_type:complete
MIINGKIMFFRREKSTYTGKFETNITALDDASVKALEGAGVIVRDEEGSIGLDGSPNKVGWGRFIVCKSTKGLPNILDAKKNVVPDTLDIGNGTVIKASVNTFDWDFKGKKGVGVGCKAFQILDLVEYAAGIDEFDEEDGTNILELMGSGELSGGTDSTSSFDIDDVDEEAVA